MKHKLAVITASFSVSFLAHAACEDHFDTWATNLRSMGNVDLAIAACKVWPMNPSLTIAALPLPHKNNDTDAGVYDLEVLVADSVTGTVRASIYQPSAITYDAVRFTGLSIDTARYQLTSSNRAFGVRLSYTGSSSIFPFDTTSLNLYVMEDKVLRPVLNRFIVQVRNGDWDGICKGTFDTTSRSIEIGTAAVEGYATLNIAEKHTNSISKMSKSDCVTKELRQTRGSFALTYHNGYYSAPKKATQEF